MKTIKQKVKEWYEKDFDKSKEEVCDKTIEYVLELIDEIPFYHPIEANGKVGKEEEIDRRELIKEIEG